MLNKYKCSFHSLFLWQVFAYLLTYSHSCDASPIIGDLIFVLENIYVFFLFSTKRSKDLTDRMKEIEGNLQLRNLSKTRWTARAESIKSVQISLDIIIETLENIIVSNNFNSLTKTKTLGLKKKF